MHATSRRAVVKVYFHSIVRGYGRIARTQQRAPMGTNSSEHDEAIQLVTQRHEPREAFFFEFEPSTRHCHAPRVKRTDVPIVAAIAVLSAAALPVSSGALLQRALGPAVSGMNNTKYRK